MKIFTMNDNFATILGYTQSELEKYFNKHILQLAKSEKKNKKELLAEIMNWYNGYKFSKKGEKYNPFSTLLFKNQDFKNYWFKNGTPAFLLNRIFYFFNYYHLSQSCGSFILD